MALTPPPALETVPLDDALERWLNELEYGSLAQVTAPENIPVEDALGRITAAPVTALQSSPHFYTAAVDGMAVRSQETVTATAAQPLTLAIGLDAIFVDTGRPMPEGFDAVVALQDIQLESTEAVRIAQPISPWQNVRPMGEDMEAREVILPQHHRIRPFDVAALLAGGLTHVPVRQRPRVGLVPIGSSLVSVGTTPAAGQSVETTTQLLAGLVRDLGGEPVMRPVAPETPEGVQAALQEGVRASDLVVLVSGPSYGTALPARVLEAVGELVLHGVSMKPGQSVCLGVVGGTPILGLPQYVVAGFLDFEMFARPVIARMLGISPPRRPVVSAVLASGYASSPGVDEFLRVKLGLVEGRIIAVPISRGADVLMSLVRADGLLRVPSATARLERGSEVAVSLLTWEEQFRQHLLVTGTHDIVLDVLRNELLKIAPEVLVHSSNVGSREGLRALARREAHLAGVHLYDEASHEYNVPFLRREAPDRPMILVNLFYRYLGLLVAEGNPKRITGLADLTREDVTFINRPPGSGTRVVLDSTLQVAGIDPARIRGYDQVAPTHMTQAAAVAGGSVDVGVGIQLSARAFHLDFVPVIPERFDLAIPKTGLSHYGIQALLRVIRSAEFKAEVAALGGYDVSATGEVMYEG